jgi:hypothetical protein
MTDPSRDVDRPIESLATVGIDEVVETREWAIPAGSRGLHTDLLDSGLTLGVEGVTGRCAFK